jgi:hypothetical protein
MPRFNAFLLFTAVLLAGCKDTQQPTWPAAAALEADDLTGSSLSLSWPAATDNKGVVSYRIRGEREGDADRGLPKVIGKVSSPKITFSAEGLSEAAEYSFKVTALDRAGNASPPLSLTATTKDVTRPTFKEGAKLTFTRTDADGKTTLTFSWPAATDNVAVTRYRLKLGEKITPIKGAARSHTVTTGAPAGMWQLSAGDAAGSWSEHPLRVGVPRKPGPAVADLKAAAAARRKMLTAKLTRLGILKILGTKGSGMGSSANLLGSGSVSGSLDRAFSGRGGVAIAGGGLSAVGGLRRRGSGGGGGHAMGIGSLGTRGIGGAGVVRIKSGPRVMLGSGPVETRRYARLKFARLKHCYVKALAKKPDLSGSATLTLAVDASGRVTATTDKETLGDAAMIGCVKTALLGRGKPEAAGTFTVKFHPGKTAG